MTSSALALTLASSPPLSSSFVVPPRPIPPLFPIQSPYPLDTLFTYTPTPIFVSAKQSVITDRVSNESITVSEEELYFITSDGIRIHGKLLRKLKFPSSSPPYCLLLCHGALAHLDWSFFPSLSSTLLSSLHHISAVFRFTFRGDGKSGGDWSFSNYYKKLNDIHSSLSLLRSAPFCYIPYGIIGHSNGGIQSLYYCSQNRGTLPNIVIISSKMTKTPLETRQKQHEECDRLGYSPQSFRAGGTVYKVLKHQLIERDEYDNEAVCRLVSVELKGEGAGYMVRTLILQGDQDDMVNTGEAEKFSSIIQNNTVRIVEGADHFFANEPEEREMSNHIVEWMRCDPLMGIWKGGNEGQKEEGKEEEGITKPKLEITRMPSTATTGNAFMSAEDAIALFLPRSSSYPDGEGNSTLIFSDSSTASSLSPSSPSLSAQTK